jgi:hypothetical protein
MDSGKQVVFISNKDKTGFLPLFNNRLIRVPLDDLPIVTWRRAAHHRAASPAYRAGRAARRAEAARAWPAGRARTAAAVAGTAAVPRRRAGRYGADQRAARRAAGGPVGSGSASHRPEVCRTLQLQRNLFKKGIDVRGKDGVSVGDRDPHVFGPPGCGSISQRYGSGYFPFLINVLSGLK